MVFFLAEAADNFTPQDIRFGIATILALSHRTPTAHLIASSSRL
jgi:hypothetical protein